MLVSARPPRSRASGAATLEEAFIAYLIDAGAGAKADAPAIEDAAAQPAAPVPPSLQPAAHAELYVARSAGAARDPVRATLALAGSLLLMFVIGFGISLDVEDLRYAVMDRDQTGLSQNYALNLSGSRYFIEHRPVTNYQDMDARMRSGELSLAIEIPQPPARAQRGKPAQIGVWIDGAMPQRAETIRGYVLGMHQGWLAQARERLGVSTAATASVETRFRYNPDVRSLPAMVPAVIPLLLLMMPAMLTALAVVREKELGSIINLYVTPVTRLEFLRANRRPMALAMLNFLLMALLAVTVFGVPVTGSFATLLLAALIYNVVATAIGLLARPSRAARSRRCSSP